MKCAICSGKRKNHWELCSDHNLALEKIVKAFGAWNRAYDGLPAKEYLTEILQRPETGGLAIDVTKFLLQDEENMSLWQEKVKEA